MKADLHVHTNYSYDAFSSPEEIVKAAIENGMDCICVTDHSKIEGAFEAMKFASDKNLLVIPGIETLSTSGDVLGINIKKVIPDGLSLEKTIEEIKKQGGIAAMAHPFDRLAAFWGVKKRLPSVNIDAIEVFNASNIFNSSNRKALNFSKKNHLYFTAGSDAHRADFVGRGYVETLRKVNSKEEFLEELKNKRVKVGGTSLGLWEILRNTSLGAIFDYYRLRIKLKRGD